MMVTIHWLGLEHLHPVKVVPFCREESTLHTVECVG